MKKKYLQAILLPCMTVVYLGIFRIMLKILFFWFSSFWGFMKGVNLHNEARYAEPAFTCLKRTMETQNKICLKLTVKTTESCK